MSDARDAPKVFCISMQRSGTTSTRKFFRDFGFREAGWPADAKEGWSLAWYHGNHEAIFASPRFKAANAYDDSPWWLPGFYKILFHRFPGSKFVLLTRDSGEWFASMLSHSGGYAIGDNRVHSKIYRRERQFFRLLAQGRVSDKVDPDPEQGDAMMQLAGHEAHYRAIYELHNTEVLDFFAQHAPAALFHARLDDPAKWQKLGAFLGVAVPAGYESRENVTADRR